MCLSCKSSDTESKFGSEPGAASGIIGVPVSPPLLLKMNQPAVTLGGEAFVWICAAANEMPRWSGGPSDFHPHE